MAEVKRRSPWDQPEMPAAPTPSKLVATSGHSPTSPAQVCRINFDVTTELHRRLRVRAAQEGVTIAEVGRQLFEEWADKE